MSGIAIKLTEANFSDKNFGVATIETPQVDKYLQYIEGDGQSYIVTKKEHNCYRLQTSDVASQIPADVPKIEIECSMPYISTDFATRCVLGTNNKHRVRLFAVSSSFITLEGNGAKVTNKEIVGKDFTQKTKLTYGSVKSYVDDIEIADNTDMTNSYRINSFSEDLIQLFYANINQDYYSKIRIYSYKVYHGDILVLNLRPFKKADGTVCMKDDLTNEYYYNAGSGNFIAGPDL